MNQNERQGSTGTHALPPITGWTQEEIAKAEAIRAMTIPVIEGATELHLDKIANTFPDANRKGRAAMAKAARTAVAEVSREWLGQTSAMWWIEHEQVSISQEIERAVKAKILAAARSGGSGRNR